MPMTRHSNSRCFWRTSAIIFRLMEAPIGAHSDRTLWRELVAHRDDTFIEDFEVFDSFVAVSVRTEGLLKIYIKPFAGAEFLAAAAAPAAPFFIASEEPAYSMSISVNPE